MVLADKNYKKVKKVAHRKKIPKKEIEIPVRVVGRAQAQNILNSSGDDYFGSQEQRFPPKEDLPLVKKIVKDEDGLPFLKTNFSPNHGLPAGVRGEGSKESKPEILSRIRERKVRQPLSQDQKEKIMWVSVVLVVSLIFFVWFAIIKSNFSFDFGVKNPFAAGSVGSVESSLQNFRDDWSTLQEQWSSLENAAEERGAASANQQVINKLKEKILVEELKNNLINTESTSENTE
jgi:hypothetical protein